MKKFIPVFFLALLPYIIKAQWISTNMPAGVNAFSLTLKNDLLIMGTIGSGIYVSTDKGASWIEKNAGIINKQIWTVDIIEDFIFAGTANGGIYRSSDNGNTWVAVNSNIPATTIIRDFVKFDNKIFAASSNSGIWVSTDNGNTWIQNNSGITGLVSIPLLITDTDLFSGVLQGIYKYNKTTSTWSKSSTGVPNLSITSFTWFKDNQGNKKIFAGLNGSTNMVVRTTNNSSSWELAESGLPKVPVSTLAQKESVIFAGNDLGVYYSVNSGDTWNDANTGFLTASYATFLTAGTDYLYVLHSGKVWKRKYTDFGIKTNISENQNIKISELKQNYPNPFTNNSTIEYKLKNTSEVSLKIFDLAGNEVYTIINEPQLEGSYKYEINAYKTGLKKGSYIYRLKTNDGNLSYKMIIE